MSHKIEGFAGKIHQTNAIAAVANFFARDFIFFTDTKFVICISCFLEDNDFIPIG